MTRIVTASEKRKIEEVAVLIAPKLVRIGTDLATAVRARMRGEQVDAPTQALYESLASLGIAIAESGHFDENQNKTQ